MLLTDQPPVTFSFDVLAGKAEVYRNQGRKIVVVQGLGFVGTAAAAVIANVRDAGGEPLYFVIGVDLASDIGRQRVRQINDGVSPIGCPDPELALFIANGAQKTGNLCATVDIGVYELADIIVVDVPFDVKDKSVEAPSAINVDRQAFEEALRTIGRLMRPEALILIETTVPVGACERLALPILREERERRHLEGPLYLAYAYERVMPGPRYVDSIRRFWRSFAGVDAASAARARDFLASFIDTENYPLWEFDDTKAAELAKLLENSYRMINIAFIYEWTLLAETMGINLFAVVDSIRVRRETHDNMRLPGFGVGGYCLTKDSLLAQWSLTNFFHSDLTLGMTLEALRINRQMPRHAFDLLKEILEGNFSGKKIVVCGVSYLPDLADTRESPSAVFVDWLIEAKASVIAHDPYVKTWRERPQVALSDNLEACLAQADAVVFAVPHAEYAQLTPQIVRRWSGKPLLIVDAQNIISDEKAAGLHALGCRLMGVGKGHWRQKGFQVNEQT